MEYTQAVERYFESLGREIVKRAKRNLKDKKGETSLSRSIKFKLKEIRGSYELQFFMDAYGNFVDKGVRGAGGIIKSGENKGNWGGKRFYKTYKGKKRQSPYIFGSRKSRGGSIYKGIEDFIKKKGIKGRDKKGRFITNKSLMFAMTKVLWIKGIHGISFFQKALQFGVSTMPEDLGAAIKKDIIDNLTRE
tara:strand:+ start:2897 stop:3469 length:573 start_codon:yes stop_codon:yes gene_type:complete